MGWQTDMRAWTGHQQCGRKERTGQENVLILPCLLPGDTARERRQKRQDGLRLMETERGALPHNGRQSKNVRSASISHGTAGWSNGHMPAGGNAVEGWCYDA